MNPNVKKYTMFLAVAVIYALFAFSMVYAFLEEPQRDNFCMNQPVPKFTEPYKDTSVANTVCGNDTYAYPSEEETKVCNEKKGNMWRKTNSSGCPAEYYCDTCDNEFNDAYDEYKFWVFMYACIFAIIAIILGITTPFVKGEFANIIAPGFIIGGLITLFMGTAMYFDAMSRIIRPIVMFIELIVVLYLIYWAVKKNK